MKSDRSFLSTPSGAVTSAASVTGLASAAVEPRPNPPGAAFVSDANPYDRSNLSANQLQVWLAQNLLPEAPIFNLAVGLQLDGAVDVECFQKAFSVLVDSSDALRTTVEEIDGIPWQRVSPRIASALELLDFSQFPDSDAFAKSWMEARCRQPLNGRGRLFDSALLRLADDRYIWYLNVHHLISDGWSFELIYRSMADLYHCAREGRLPQTIELPLFADYLAYEQAYRQSPRYHKTEAYWRAFLADAGEAVGFYGRVPVAMTTRVRRVSHDIGRERTQKLKAAATALAGGADHAALFDVFAAVLIGYLRCLNGHDTFTIGVPFHNRRSKSSFKETIGFFSEVLPVRVAIAEDESFATLVKKFNGEIRRTLRYGQYSVTNPLLKRVYEVTLNYHTRSFSDFAGIHARPEWIHNGHGDESLAVQIHDFGSADNLAIDFDLHEAVFEEGDGERVVTHLMRVLDAFLGEPDKPLRHLSLATESETRRILAELSKPAAETEAWCPVHEAFSKRAIEAPEHPAVLSECETVTYSQLSRRSRSIASLLRARGVGSQAPVAIYLTRRPAMIAAMLGVLRAGAAYVPVDPRYSSEWLKFILEDTRAPVVLTERDLASEVPESGAEVICLDEIPADGDGLDETSAEIVGDDLAYIIYTSGSTGTPKGVEITHRALANFASEAVRLFEIAPSDRVLQFASISFDTSVEEIFPCLTGGASLVLWRESESVPGAGFLEKCRTSQVTVLDLPTAYWNELTAYLCTERQVIPDLIRLVVIGGERAIPERVALWQAFVTGKARLLNTYGPTETTVAATMADLTHAPVQCGVGAEVAIGRPIANVQALLLDPNLNPVPEGVPGELYIGGVGLARGYLGRPDLAADKFIPNPFDGGAGSRLYRTGDIVRYRQDGNLEFLRRSDSQLKIRGFRVEPEGIAAVLRQHPFVREAAVLQEGNANSSRLVAYIVPGSGAVLHLTDIQNFVRARLPEYMVPVSLVALESMPLTPRGKLDRRALHLAQNRQAENSEPLVPPQTPVEERIARIWCELLALREVGRNQHFFELGGHSLLAAQAVSRIRREFGVEILLRAIFEAPTIAMLAEQVEEALLQRGAPEEMTPLQFGSYNGHAPASDSQLRIWYMDQFAPESSAYNVTAAIRFTGTLDRAALRQGVDQLVQRHESLRTTVANSGGEPVQVIAPTLRLEVPEIDLRAARKEEKIDLARQILTEEGRRPFDLSQGPLFRLLLLELDERDYVLLLSMHHLISDQWSMGVIAREISASYNSYRNAASSPLDLPLVQYGDFAVWQSQRLSPERLEKDLDYWRRQLDGVQPAAIPTDHPRPAVQTFKGAHRTLSLSASLIDKLKRLALDENATLYMVFLAAFKILLSRYTAREDIALGSPVANRTRGEWESVIGTFINLLVLRTDLSGSPSLREIVRRVREVVLSAFTHQEMSFQKLVEELAPGRDASRLPLVQILFNFQNAPLGNVKFDGVSWAPFEIDQWSSQFDLSVTVDPEITRKVFLSYNTDLYDSATIDGILRYYAELLEALATDAEQALPRLSLFLTTGERTQEENRLAYPQKCLHEMFEKQASRTPDAIALVYESRQLTYRQLNESANHLARRLRGIGVGPEILVGICAQRSPELVAGLLAILKAGGAYVPIDPTYPSERITFILKDSAVAALVTQRCLRPQLPDGDVPILCLDEVLVNDRPESVANLEPAAQPDNLAYVIYTSGSTGQPKGVQIPHRALVSFLCSMKERPGIAAEDILLSVTTISFDIAALELFLPLISGARTVIAARETAADGNALVSQLAASGASVMQATPTSWRMMIDAGWQGETGNLKALCGGESLPVKLAQDLTERSDSVWNLYGPSETTVWSSIWPVEPDSDRIAIGRPIHNTQIRVLDANLRPVPPGLAGEIYIGGEGLARGYLNRADLTAEKFVPDPLGPPSSRLYRTGDLGRSLADGNLEFIGRLDNQVKIRGFRIELGEIEAVLCGHPNVKQAVASVTAGERLAGYLVLAGNGHSVTAGELREYVRHKLPAYMVPSVFMFLESLPLTPNGKIDRRALPPPQGEDGLASETGAPRTAIEQIIQGIWQEVLKIPQAGTHESFFDLGGHSLLATQVIARMREAFQVELPLRVLFEFPTIAELGVRVEEARGEGRERLPAITKSRNAFYESVSFAQERLWFLNRLQPGNSAYHVCLAARAKGPLDFSALDQAFAAVVKRHEVLRASFPAIDGRPTLAVSPVGPDAITLVDLTDLPETERLSRAVRFGEELGSRPFDLEGGSLLRAVALRLGEDDHVLIFVAHHIIFDAVSADIFLGNLTEFYRLALAGESTGITEPALQYADYAAWQRAWLSGESGNRQLDYWVNQLKEPPSLLRLPTDRPRPPVKSFRGASHCWTITPATVKALGQLSRSENATLFMVLLAAFKTLLHRYSGEEDIVIGVPVSNRGARETEGLIGLFVNTLAMRTDLTGDPSFRGLLRRVRETALGAYGHQDLPFEQLVQHLNLKRELAYTPLFQVMFAFQNRAPATPAVSGLVFQPMAVDSRTAKFDLTLAIVEDDEQLHAALEYDTDLFDRATVERMSAQLQSLLDSVMAEPDRRLSELKLLGETDRERIIHQWSAGAPRTAEPECIHRLFEAQAGITPDAVAIACAGQSLSYRELNEAANRLAHRLQKLGIAPEARVGICMERSLALPVALLATLKAGGAYVPLDPKMPRARLNLMIRDAGCAVLVTQSWLVDCLPRDEAVVICLDSLAEIGADETLTNLDVSVTTDNAVYVIYTSGSTGMSKGTVLPHRAVANYLTWATRAYAVDQGKGAAVFSSISFDLTVTALFAPLLVGRRVELLPEEASVEALALALRCHDNLSFLKITPSHLDLLKGELSKTQAWENTRVLIVGGENLTASHIRFWRDALPEAAIVNEYGPTETAVGCCAYRIPQTEHESGSIPIGRPITATQAYILDSRLEPVPLGVIGELYIGGEGLARGYLNRPDLTAEKFIPDPFGAPSSRLYRTGDLGRYSAGGNIEFIGRTDNQVKLRGFRIELGEVEAVLSEHEAVSKVAVVVSGEGADKRLLAYVVLRAGRHLAEKELCGYAQQKLPTYMVPSAFVFLEGLPLTLNGKIDRHALPVPGGVSVIDRGTLPGDKLEFELLHLWRKLLGVSTIRSRDSFFDLGGDSLRAASLIARVEKRFGQQIRLIDFFAAPTIEGLAALLRARGCSSNWAFLLPIRPHGSKPPFFWVHGDGSNFLLPSYLGADRPFYGFMHQSQDGALARYTTVEEIAAHYLEELCSVQAEGPYCLGGYSFGGLVAFEMAQQLKSRGAEVALLALLEPTSPSVGQLHSVEQSSDAEKLGDRYSRERAHGASLQTFRAAEQVVYVTVSVMRWLKNISRLNKLKRSLKAAIYRFCERSGRRMPRFVRTAYLMRIYSEAARQYNPTVYSAPVIVFTTARNTHRHFTRWSRLLTQARNYPVSGDHAGIIQEPQLAVWATELKDRIDKAAIAPSTRN